MFRHRSATPAGVTGNGEVRSLGDNVTSILGSAVGARADTATASTQGSWELETQGMRLKRNEVLLKVVMFVEPLSLTSGHTTVALLMAVVVDCVAEAPAEDAELAAGLAKP